jgi:hypothetical protein
MSPGYIEAAPLTILYGIEVLIEDVGPIVIHREAEGNFFPLC